MSERKPSLVVIDILNSIDHINTYNESLSFIEFSANTMVIEASLYNIQIIGEAVSHLPEEVKKLNPDIPWNLIKGMRNRLIHEYFGTDVQVVWDVIKNDIPTLKTKLEKLKLKLLQENK